MKIQFEIPVDVECKFGFTTQLGRFCIDTKESTIKLEYEETGEYGYKYTKTHEFRLERKDCPWGCQPGRLPHCRCIAQQPSSTDTAFSKFFSAKQSEWRKAGVALSDSDAGSMREGWEGGVAYQASLAAKQPAPIVAICAQYCDTCNTEMPYRGPAESARCGKCVSKVK